MFNLSDDFEVPGNLRSLATWCGFTLSNNGGKLKFLPPANRFSILKSNAAVVQKYFFIN